MNIAIFHELEIGGAHVMMCEIIKELIISNHRIDLYSTKNNLHDFSNIKKIIVEQKIRKNILEDTIYSVSKLKHIHKKLANIINKTSYDIIIVFPSIETQSPHILQYINNKDNLYYIFTEPKREFYEKTDYSFSIKKLIAKIIRIPIKLVDINNCKKASNIITISYYCKYLLKEIYKKNSYVIYPGLKTTKIQKVTLKPKKYLSNGTHTYLKGHDITIKQFSGINKRIKIIGSNTINTKKLKKLAIMSNTKIKFLNFITNTKKDRLIAEAPIFISNYRKEPFGIATLEATASKCLIYGLNESGTSEIVRHGLNGILYPDSKSIYRKIAIESYRKQNHTYYLFQRISWNNYLNKFLSIYHYLKNEPKE